jgi:hypothetical protein
MGTHTLKAGIIALTMVGMVPVSGLDVEVAQEGAVAGSETSSNLAQTH